jgi:peptidyl-tRNA hydrolase
MSTDKSKIAAKIKALLAKTTESGCTEGEAMAAIAKASALMAEHEVSMTEADLLAEGFAEEELSWESRKIHTARNLMGVPVAKYTDTRIWTFKETASKKGLRFFGLSSNVIFAKWLLESLTQFAVRGANDFITAKIEAAAKKHDLPVHIVRDAHRTTWNREWGDFLLGATNRIVERLRAEKKAPVISNDQRNALVVIDKGKLVALELAKRGVRLKTNTAKGRNVNADAYDAGTAAGDGAAFHRPVNAGGTTFAIGR